MQEKAVISLLPSFATSSVVNGIQRCSRYDSLKALIFIHGAASVFLFILSQRHGATRAVLRRAMVPRYSGVFDCGHPANHTGQTLCEGQVLPLPQFRTRLDGL